MPSHGGVRADDDLTAPEKRSPAYLGKVGFDKQLSKAVRFRLTSSLFSQARSANQSLYSGDRGGSRYYQVMVNTAGTEKDSAWTGNVQPGLRSAQHSWFVTPTVLLKSEWMQQMYKDFPALDIRNGGKIKGFMVEGVVAF